MTDIRKMTHTVRKATHTLTYWKDGSACTSDEKWTHVEMRSNIPFHSSKQFTKSQMSLLLWIEAMLEDAHTIGRSSLATDMKNLLNI